MKCKKCGTELVDSNAKVCSSCGAKISDSFPVWAIVLIVIFCLFFFGLPIVGVVAAMTIPTVVTSAETAKNRTIFKKTVSTLNQALMISYAVNGSYNKTSDLWNKGIKEQLIIEKELENGIRLADLTEIKYRDLGHKCSDAPSVPSEATACAVLTIDADGFDKGQNAKSYLTGGSTMMIKDRFVVLLYASSVVPYPNSIEAALLKPSKE